MENLSKYIIILLFLSSCTLTSYVYDPIYEDHPHTTEVFWYNDYEIGGSPYFGYWSGFYYYYGIPHYYPWWYYYQFIPPYHYHTHTHVHVHCDNGHYVYSHRGSKFNNKENKNFSTNIKIKENHSKTNVFPYNWKSNNSTRTNKQNELKYNISKQNYNRTFNLNNSNTNKNINFNKNKSNNRSNNNRSNNKSSSSKKRP
tara:strand:+ start:536 stop:1132 length:597 start_codon:yes stop_codon:yes gene_type:complete